MSSTEVLVAIADIPVHPEDALAIKRNELLPLLNDPYRLNHYADQLIQAQSALLKGIDPQLTQRLSQVIENLIQLLSDSKKYLKKRKFNGLQKWLGLDLEFGSNQVEYYKNIDRNLDEANHLSQRLQIEIQKAQSRFNQLQGLREQMAKYIQAAEEFLQEYPSFAQQPLPLDSFAERLSKKIQTLKTLQASNDIAMMQMHLSQQLSFSLLDRYKEAQQVLIPAWQHHVQQSQQSGSTSSLEKLDNSRDKLIKTLKKSLEKPSKT